MQTELITQAQIMLEKQELQELYGAIYQVMEKMTIDEGSSLYEKSQFLAKKVVGLINLLKEGGNRSSFCLSKYLVPLIKIILEAPNILSFNNIPEQYKNKFNNHEKIREYLVDLYNLCADKQVGHNLKNIMRDVQVVFMGDVIFNVNRNTVSLKQQQILWQLHQKKSQTLEEKKRCDQVLEEIQSNLEKIERKTDSARKFCAIYQAKP